MGDFKALTEPSVFSMSDPCVEAYRSVLALQQEWMSLFKSSMIRYSMDKTQDAQVTYHLSNITLTCQDASLGIYDVYGDCVDDNNNVKSVKFKFCRYPCKVWNESLSLLQEAHENHLQKPLKVAVLASLKNILFIVFVQKE
jgi:hypothetical protein